MAECIQCHVKCSTGTWPQTYITTVYSCGVFRFLCGKIIYMYIILHGNKKNIFNQNSSLLNWLQQQSYKYSTWPWTASVVELNCMATVSQMNDEWLHPGLYLQWNVTMATATQMTDDGWVDPGLFLQWHITVWQLPTSGGICVYKNIGT
jgi:hypothetical protein